MSRFKRKNRKKFRRKSVKKTPNYFLKLIKNNGFIKKNGKKQTYSGKLTPMVQRRVLEAVDLGLPIDQSCHLVGINKMTYYNWLSWGRREAKEIEDLLNLAIEELSEAGKLDVDDPLEMEEFIDEFMKLQKPNKFFNFYTAVEQAKAIAHSKALGSIRQAAEGGKYLSETVIQRDNEGNITGEKLVERHLRPDWNAGAWWLSRKYPKLYSERIVQEGVMDHAHEHNVKIDLPESIDRVADVLGILLGSGFVQRRLVEHSGGKLPTAQRITDA